MFFLSACMCGKYAILSFLSFLNILLELRDLKWVLYSRCSLTTAENMCKSNGAYSTSGTQGECQTGSQSYSCGVPGHQGCACVHTQCTWAINSLSRPGTPAQMGPWTDLSQRTYFSQGEWLNPSHLHSKVTNWCRSFPSGNFGQFWRFPQEAPAVPGLIWTFHCIDHPLGWIWPDALLGGFCCRIN